MEEIRKHNCKGCIYYDSIINKHDILVEICKYKKSKTGKPVVGCLDYWNKQEWGNV
jgi:hypothetical protein